jgi:hypothetical protein
VNNSNPSGAFLKRGDHPPTCPIVIAAAINSLFGTKGMSFFEKKEYPFKYPRRIYAPKYLTFGRSLPSVVESN